MKKFFILVLAFILFSVPVFSQVWLVETQTDLMSGATRQFVASTAEASEGTLNEPILAFRLVGTTLEVMVVWGGYSMDELQGSMVKFGTDTAIPWPVDGISHNKEVIFMGDVSKFLAKIKTMSPSDTIVIKCTRATGASSVARWYVGNIHSVSKGVLPGW